MTLGVEQRRLRVRPRGEPPQRDDVGRVRESVFELAVIDRQRNRSAYGRQVEELDPVHATRNPVPALQKCGQLVHVNGPHDAPVRSAGPIDQIAGRSVPELVVRFLISLVVLVAAGGP
jgi:hypothetical protein